VNFTRHVLPSGQSQSADIEHIQAWIDLDGFGFLINRVQLFTQARIDLVTRLQDEYLANPLGLGQEGNDVPDEVDDLFDYMSDEALTEVLLTSKAMDKQKLMCVKQDQVSGWLGLKRGGGSGLGKRRKGTSQSYVRGSNFAGWWVCCWVRGGGGGLEWEGTRVHRKPANLQVGGKSR
jgi:hypothetical protein